MTSPFPTSTSAPGEGHIVVKQLPNGVSDLESVTYQYPLKLIAPSRSADQRSVLVFLLSYGGGLVGGDSVRLSIRARPKARLSIVTQGHTKIFTSESRDILTSQTLKVTIERNAALCLLPDPVQPFAGSVYQQTQIFHVEDGASLCLLDWVTQGRTARGENWSFERWVGCNEVWHAEPGKEPEAEAGARDSLGRRRLLVRDTVIMDAERQSPKTQTLRETMRGKSVFGTLILRGPLVKGLGDFILAEFAALPRLGARDFRSSDSKQLDEEKRSPLKTWRADRLQQEAADKVLWSAASVRGCVVVKFGAATVEGGRLWIGSMIKHEGSVAESFGSQALMCVA